MGVLDKLKSVMGGGDVTPTHSYQCGDCSSRFKAQARHPKDAVCPDCDSDNIHTAV